MFVTKFVGQATLAAGILLSASCATQAEDYSKEDIESIVREYILENPEIIAEAIYVLQDRAEKEKAAQAAQALGAITETLNFSDLDPVGGNPDGKITIVEFFDYNCGYCKRANATLQQLAKNNSDLRIVYKEWPILSETSATAATISLAVNLTFPEQYEEFHQTLLGARSLRSEEDIWKLVDKANLDREAINANMNNEKINQHLVQTSKLAKQLGITGTPAFIVGDSVLKGAYPIEDIQAAIDQTRSQTDE